MIFLFSVHFLPPFSPSIFVSLPVFLFFQGFCHLSPALFLPLDTVPSRLVPPFSPNLETPPHCSSSRPAGPSRQQGWGVRPRGAEFVLSAFQFSVRDLLSAPYPVTG